jgi:hypothetical protein
MLNLVVDLTRAASVGLEGNVLRRCLGESPQCSVQSRVIKLTNIPNDVHIVQHHFGVHVLIFRCRSWRLNDQSRYRHLISPLSRFSAHTGDINFLVFNA